MATSKLAPGVTLANGVVMPGFGLGTWPMDDREAETNIVAAIEAGYRLFDTAENYGNEGGVGKGIRASGIDRGEVFVTTKFNGKWHGYDEAQQAWENSAQRLGLDYIDLLLIHWPLPGQNRYVDAWRGMLKLLEDGKVRAVGVSNFKPAHIDRLLAETGVAPHVNQIELNPRVTRRTERVYHEEHGIVTEAWAPLAKGNDLLKEAPVRRLAERYSRTPAQIVLRWLVQQNAVPIPKTSNPERLTQNIDVFDFELGPDDLDEIATLDRHGEGAVDSDRTGH